MGRATFRAAVLAALACLAAACASPCEELAGRFCGTCGDLLVDSHNQVNCACVEKGALTRDDGPEGYFSSDTDAAIACDEVLLNLKHVGEDGAATCRVGLALLDDMEVEACEHVTVPAFSVL